MTPGWNCSRARSRRALWLCRTFSHQWPTTYCGTNTTTISRGLLPADVLHVVDDRPGDLAVGRLEHGERHRQVVALPVGLQAARLGVVHVDGQRGQVVRPGGPGERQRPQGRLVHLRDQHDRVHLAGQHPRVGVGDQLLGDVRVVPVDRLHQHEQDRHRDEDQPRPVGELGEHDDHQHDGGQRPADGVDDLRPAHPPAHLRVALDAQLPLPVPDHAPLADGEAGEDADDVELDQPGDVGLERDDQQPGEAGQQQDAVAEGQLVAAGVQLPGQEPVLGQHRAQQREAVEGGVRGQDQHERGGRLDVEEADRAVAAERGRGELRDHRALRLGLAVREAHEVAGVLDVLDARTSRARAVTPANRVAAMPPMSASVVAALRLFGGLNAGTPLAMASMPVSAVVPEAKARRAKKTQRQAGQAGVARAPGSIEYPARLGDHAGVGEELADQPGARSSRRGRR